MGFIPYYRRIFSPAAWRKCCKGTFARYSMDRCKKSYVLYASEHISLVFIYLRAKLEANIPMPLKAPQRLAQASSDSNVPVCLQVTPRPGFEWDTQSLVSGLKNHTLPTETHSSSVGGTAHSGMSCIGTEKSNVKEMNKCKFIGKDGKTLIANEIL